MAWYDPFLIISALAGILIISFHAHHKGNTFIGYILILGALLIKAFLWFESLI